MNHQSKNLIECAFKHSIQTATALAVLSAGLYAQVATSTKKTAEDTSEPKKEEIVVISPFKVVSDDRGYQATNTMSGTRLNVKQEDVLVTVPVVTKQQMIDPPCSI